MDSLVPIISIIMIAGFVQGAMGFGFGLVAISLLSIFINIKEASLILILSGLSLNVFIFIQLCNEFKFEKILSLFICSLIGVPLGVLVLEKADALLLKHILGWILLLSVTQRLIPTLRSKKWHPYWLAIPCGFFSGTLTGAFGTGAPPIVAYISSQNFGKMRYSASLQFILGTSAIIRLAFLSYSGMLTLKIFTISFIGSIFVLIGAYLGLKVMEKIQDNIMSYIITFIFFILGIKYII